MANDNTLNVEIKAIITDLERNLKKATKGLEKFSAKSKAIGKKMQSTGIAMSKGFTAPLAILGGVALKAAADLETLETSLSVMTGSAESGKKLLKDLTDFAAKTPFQLEGIGNTAKVLLAFGFTAVEVKENLKALGDVAAGSGTPLGELGRVFGQVAAAGKLTGERLLQFQERAVPIGPALAKTMGVAESSIKEMVSAGKVSFKDFEKAFKSLSLEGGIFENAMIKQSKTLAGVFSTLKDNVQLALGELGQEIATTFDLRAVTTKLIGYIQKITKWFANLDKGTKATILKFIAFAGVVGPILITLGFFATTVLPGLVTAFGFLSAAIVTATGATARFTIALLSNPIGAAAALIIAAAGAFALLLDRITGLNDTWQTFMNALESGGNVTEFVRLQTLSYAKALDEQNKKQIESGRASREADIVKRNLAQAEYDLGLATDGTTNAIIKQIAAQKAQADADKERERKKGLFGSFRSGGSSFGAAILENERLSESLTTLEADLIPVTESISSKMQDMSVNISSSLQGAATAMAQGMADMVGALITGEMGMGDIGASILGLMGSIISQLGAAVIAAGVAALALELAISNPFTAIAAGVAAVALGAAMGAAAKSVSGNRGDSRGSARSGGASDNSSFRGSSSSGFSGGSSGGTVVFEIAGTKLIGVIKNTADRNRALGGTTLTF